MNLTKKDYEKQMNKMFNYKDGRNIKKKDMVSLFSLVNEVPTEIALQHFPELTKTSVEMIKSFCENSKEGFKSNETTSFEVLAIVRERVEGLETELKSGNHSDEVKIELISSIKDITKLAVDVQQGTQNLIQKSLAQHKELIFGCFIGIIAVLGVNAKLNMPNLAKEVA